MDDIIDNHCTVQCTNCDHVYDSEEGQCPFCGDDECVPAYDADGTLELVFPQVEEDQYFDRMAA